MSFARRKSPWPLLAASLLLVLATACTSDGTPSPEQLRERVLTALGSETDGVLHVRMITGDPPPDDAVTFEAWYDWKSNAERSGLRGGRRSVSLRVGDLVYSNLPSLDAHILEEPPAGPTFIPIAWSIDPQDGRASAEARVKRIEGKTGAIWRLEQEYLPAGEDADGPRCLFLQQDFDAESYLPISVWSKLCSAPDRTANFARFESVERLDRGDLPEGFLTPEGIRAELVAIQLEALSDPPAFWLGEEIDGFQLRRIEGWEEGADGPRASIEYGEPGTGRSFDLSLSRSSYTSRTACDPRPLNEPPPARRANDPDPPQPVFSAVETAIGVVQQCTLPPEGSQLRLHIGDTVVVLAASRMPSDELLAIAERLAPVDPSAPPARTEAVGPPGPSADSFRSLTVDEARSINRSLRIATGDEVACDTCARDEDFTRIVERQIERCLRNGPSAMRSHPAYDPRVLEPILTAYEAACGSLADAQARLGAVEESAPWRLAAEQAKALLDGALQIDVVVVAVLAQDGDALAAMTGHTEVECSRDDELGIGVTPRCSALGLPGDSAIEVLPVARCELEWVTESEVGTYLAETGRRLVFGGAFIPARHPLGPRFATPEQAVLFRRAGGTDLSPYRVLYLVDGRIVFSEDGCDFGFEAPPDNRIERWIVRPESLGYGPSALDPAADR